MAYQPRASPGFALGSGSAGILAGVWAFGDSFTYRLDGSTFASRDAGAPSSRAALQMSSPSPPSYLFTVSYAAGSFVGNFVEPCRRRQSFRQRVTLSWTLNTYPPSEEREK